MLRDWIIRLIDYYYSIGNLDLKKIEIEYCSIVHSKVNV